MENALQITADRYTAGSHVAVHIFVAPPDGLAGLIRHRARADVVVADTTTVAGLAAGRFVRPETVMSLGQNPYVLIGKAGAFQPLGGEAGRLLAAHATVIPDPTTAASFDGPAILRAALPPGASSHEIGVSDTPAVIAMVQADSAILGLVQQTQGHAPGIVEAAILPVPPAPVSAALVAQGQSANAAALLAFIAGPAGAAILHAAGLEAKL